MKKLLLLLMLLIVNFGHSQIELIEKRKIHSKTFLNKDGSLTSNFSTVPLHYDSAGYLTTYSNNIDSLGLGVFKLSNTNIPISYDTELGLIEIVIKNTDKFISYCKNSEITFYNSEYKQIRKDSINSNINYNKKENIFKEINLWDSIDRIQTINYHSIKTDYIINEKPKLDIKGGYIRFTEEYELPNNWYINKGRGKKTKLGWEGELIIYNELGETMLTFVTPYFYDSNHKTKYNYVNEGVEITDSLKKEKTLKHSIYGSFDYKILGNKLKLSTNVDGDWLLNANRVYPITIDPTLFFTVVGSDIPSCFWTGVSTATKICQITPGSEVIESQTNFIYRAQNGAWMSESYTLIEGNNNTYQWFRCNINQGGNCNIIPAVQFNDFANGIYPNGEVPITIGITRVWGGFGCNNIYSFILTNSWETSITFIEPINLPVELSSFTFTCDPIHTLNWTTESETNSAHFEVQVSDDGLEWTTVRKLQGQGNKSTKTEYEYSSRFKYNYYRLKQVDFDGQYEYFGPLSADCDKEDIRVYPNPTTGIVNIAFNTTLNNFNVQILDATGRILLTDSFEETKNIFFKQYDISDFSTGVYQIKINNKVYKIVKK